MERRHFLASMAAATILPTWAHAQSTPVRIVVGAPPGGGTDSLARTLAAELSRIAGGTFLVENRPGAGGNIAAQYVANAAPDGSTLLLCYTSHAINATLYSNLGFDPVSSFTPVSYVASAPSILCAHPSVAANDMPGLIALARQSPGKLNIALPGIGSAGHLGAEVLKMMAGIDMVSVPYKGTAPAMNDVVGGQVDMMFAGLALARGQLDDKRLKPLGLSSRDPLADFPQAIPIDRTLPGYDFSAWYGLLGPAGMDKRIADAYSVGVREGLENEKSRNRLRHEGMLVTASTPESFNTFLASEIQRWGAVVKASGATAG